tara:strand:- start:3417 stop:5105 length:1689 start_codon:yes stop_codon:yes gene_type:complete
MANKITVTNTTNKITITQNSGNNVNPTTDTKSVTINTSNTNNLDITAQGAIGPPGPRGPSGDTTIFGNHLNNQIAVFRFDNNNQLKATSRPQVSGYAVSSPPSFNPHVEAGTPAFQYNNNNFLGYGEGTPRNSSFVMDSIDFPVQLYNPFQNYSQNRFFDSIRSNRFHGKSKRIAVSFDGGSFQEVDTFFNGNYDSAQRVAEAGEKKSIFLDFKEYGLTGTNGITYPEGRLHLNFYYFSGPREVSASLYHRNPQGTETTKSISFEPYDFQSQTTAGSYHSWRASIDQLNYLCAIELHITASDERETKLTQIEYLGKRMTYGEAGDLSRQGGYVRSLTLSDQGLFFEGSVEDNFETKLTVINPTADRTITFPDTTGNVILNTSASFITDITTTGDVAATNITASGEISASGRIDGERIGSFRNLTTFGRTHFELYRPFGSTPEMGRVGALSTGVSTTYNEDKGYRLYLTNLAGGASVQTQHLAVMQNGDVEIDSKSAEQSMNLSGSAKLFVGGNISTNSHITASGAISASGTVESDGLILSSPNGTRYKIIVDNLGNLSTTSA